MKELNLEKRLSHLRPEEMEFLVILINQEKYLSSREIYELQESMEGYERIPLTIVDREIIQDYVYSKIVPDIIEEILSCSEILRVGDLMSYMEIPREYILSVHRGLQSSVSQGKIKQLKNGNMNFYVHA